MNELQTFANNEFGAVRSMMIDDVPRFVGRDVAVALGYSNPRKTLGAHVDDEDKNTVTIRDGIQGEPQHDYHQRIRAVQLDFLQQAPPPAAKRFKHWVTNEVLPAIRKTGKSATQDEVPPRELTSDDYFRAASIVATCKNERLPYVLSYPKMAGISAAYADQLKGKDDDRDKYEVIRHQRRGYWQSNGA